MGIAKPSRAKSATANRAASALAAATIAMATALPAKAAPMTVRGLTTQPIGHHTFCQAVPAECQPTGEAAPDRLSRERWKTIQKINNRINSEIQPRTDMEMWGVNELWSYPETVGDCEDYVLLKRHLLIQAGFHPSNLLITVARQPNGDGHAVLTVRTDMGDFILDNMRSDILDWRDTEYRYLKRQSTAHAGRWVTISDTRSSTVVARR